MLPASIRRLFSRPGPRFALLVVLCLAGVATPLAEVWRRQGLELQSTFSARRALEAVALVAQTQRALVAHRPYAAAVLAGRGEQEPERVRRQQAVDTEMGALVAALELHHLYRALDEADLMRSEWSNLLAGIGRRKLPVASSDAAHDLLVEQAFVIMDLAGGQGGLPGQVGRAFRTEEWTLALRTLPRYTVALAALDGAAPTALSGADRPGSADPAAALARRVAREAGDLLAALDAAGADEPPPDPALVRSLVALRHSVAPLAQAPDAGADGLPAEPTVQRAHRAAIAAHTALIARLDARLAESATVLGHERSFVALAGLLAMLLGAYAACLAVPRRALPASAHAACDDASGDPEPLDTAAAAAGAESQGPASDLLERLRRRSAEAGSGGAVQPEPPTQH